MDPRPSANKTGSIGFVSDPRRVNVAVSRARRMCVVFGDQNTMAPHGRGGTDWAGIRRACRFETYGAEGCRWKRDPPTSGFTTMLQHKRTVAKEPLLDLDEKTEEESSGINVGAAAFVPGQMAAAVAGGKKPPGAPGTGKKAKANARRKAAAAAAAAELAHARALGGVGGMLHGGMHGVGVGVGQRGLLGFATHQGGGFGFGGGGGATPPPPQQQPPKPTVKGTMTPRKLALGGGGGGATHGGRAPIAMPLVPPGVPPPMPPSAAFPGVGGSFQPVPGGRSTAPGGPLAPPPPPLARLDDASDWEPPLASGPLGSMLDLHALSAMSLGDNTAAEGWGTPGPPPSGGGGDAAGRRGAAPPPPLPQFRFGDAPPPPPPPQGGTVADVNAAGGGQWPSLGGGGGAAVPRPRGR